MTGLPSRPVCAQTLSQRPGEWAWCSQRLVSRRNRKFPSCADKETIVPGENLLESNVGSPGRKKNSLLSHSLQRLARSQCWSPEAVCLECIPDVGGPQGPILRGLHVGFELFLWPAQSCPWLFQSSYPSQGQTYYSPSDFTLNYYLSLQSHRFLEPKLSTDEDYFLSISSFSELDFRVLGW